MDEVDYHAREIIIASDVNVAMVSIKFGILSGKGLGTNVKLVYMFMQCVMLSMVSY